MVLFNSEFIGVFDIILQKHRKSAATRPLGTFHHPETINVMNVIISRRRVWKITPPQNEIYTWRTENERFAMCGTCTQWLIIDYSAVNLCPTDFFALAWSNFLRLADLDGGSPHPKKTLPDVSHSEKNCTDCPVCPLKR